MLGFLKRLRQNRKRQAASNSLIAQVHEGLGGPTEQMQQTPSDNYLEVVEAFDNVVRDCSFVSRQFGGIPAETSQHFWASALFTSMCSRSVSMAILAPCSPWAERVVEHWDYASLTGVARSLMELRLAFYYLCVEQISRDEWECRWNIFNLHDCKSRIRLMQASDEMWGKEPNEEIALMEEQARELQDRLLVNETYTALPEKRRAMFLKGENAYMMPLEDVAEKAGLGRARYRYFQRLFSGHTHALPMSFYRIGADGRGRGLPNPVEENYTSLCLSFSCSVLVSTRDDMLRLFGGPDAVENHHARAE